MSQELRDRPISLGVWCQSADPLILDAAAAAGPDWVCIDTQHGAALSTLSNATFAILANYGVPSLVRVASINASLIGRSLDLGANGIVVPLVDTSEDAALALSATRHAPDGTRSYGMQTNRVGPFDEEPFVVIQVETAAAVENLSDICKVDGVDALYVGPADLGLSLVGEPKPGLAAFENETVASALESVVATAEAHGMIAGYHCDSAEEARVAAERGFRMMAVASDVGLIKAGLTSELDSSRS